MIVSMTKEEFKYPNHTPINIETFCDKTPYLMDCAGGNYQVEDSIGVIRSGSLAHLSDNLTWYQS